MTTDKEINDGKIIVLHSIKQWLDDCWTGLEKDLILNAPVSNDPAEESYLELTVATNDTWTDWDFQTGDNSFHGPAYFYPHWAVVTIYEGDDVEDVFNDIKQQLEDLTENWS